MKRTILIIAAFLLIFAFHGFAQCTWQAAGPSDSVRSTLNGVFYNSYQLVMDTTGTFYIGYEDIGNNYKATVRKYNGTMWVNIGNPGFSVGGAQFVSLAVTRNGTPYISYVDHGAGQKAYVSTFNGSSWVITGGGPLSSGHANYTSIITSKEDTVYVAYTDSSIGWKCSVMKFNGTSWTYVGNRGFTGFASSPILQFDTAGVLNMFYCDEANGSKASVMKFNGSAWVNVGAPDFSTARISDLAFAISKKNTSFVAYRDLGNSGNLTVMKFNGTSWVPLGPLGFAGTDLYNSIVIDSANQPYVAFWDWPNNGGTVMKFDTTSNSWAIFGPQHASMTGNCYGNSLIMGKKDTLYLAVNNGDLDNALVNKLVGNSWVPVPANAIGFAGPDQALYSFSNVVFDLNGSPLVGFPDKLQGSKESVMQYLHDSAWVYVGNPGFSTTSASRPSLAMSPGGNPYAMFNDNINEMEVMEYSGGSWNFVGTNPLTGSNNYFPTMAINSSSVPYAGWLQGSDQSIHVSYYNGSSWIAIPSLPRGNGVIYVNGLQIAISPADTLYAIEQFQRTAGNYFMAVLKYDGAQWDSVGGVYANYTDGINNFAFAVSSANIAYFCYTTYNLATNHVLQLQGNTWTEITHARYRSPNYPTPGFTLDNNGTPLLFYSDSVNHGRGTIMQYNGIGWSSIGTAITAGTEVGAEMAVNSAGTIYVVYFGDYLFALKGTCGPLNVEGTKPRVQQAVSVYPNPSNGKFTIAVKGYFSGNLLKVYNTLGQEIYHTTIKGSETHINLSGNPPGIYLYRIIDNAGNTTASGKVVIE